MTALEGSEKRSGGKWGLVLQVATLCGVLATVYKTWYVDTRALGGDLQLKPSQTKLNESGLRDLQEQRLRPSARFTAMAELSNPTTVEKLVLGISDKGSVKCREFVVDAGEKISFVVGKNHIVITQDEVSINGIAVNINSGGPEPGKADEPPGLNVGKPNR